MTAGALPGRCVVGRRSGRLALAGLAAAAVVASGMAVAAAARSVTAPSGPETATATTTTWTTGPASATAPPLPQSRPAAAAGAPLQPCRIPGIRTEVRCGSLRRPLDPGRPDARSIDVHYVVVPALARNKLPDPVLLLAGGPGQSAIAVAANLMPLFGRLNHRRDIVFIDQRGTGRSAPLACEEAPKRPLAEALDSERQVALALACRDRLAALPYVGGADGLRFFTTAAAAQDLDAVRRQLGARRVNLVGGSYGTRLALELLRQSPASVRRSVLDGVAPADMALPASMAVDSQAALDALFAACAAEPACVAAQPALRERFGALLASLPRQVSLADPVSGKPHALRLTRDALLGLIRGPLYAPSLAAALPQAIGAAADGRFEPLAGLHALQTPRRAAQPALGLHFSVACAEDVPQLPDAATALGSAFGHAASDMYRRICAEWPRGAVPAGFYEIPPAGSAVLLLSGGVDPVTPARHGERVAARLGRLARHVTVPQAGHGVLGIGCAREVLHRFIEADDDRSALAVDAGCLAGLPRPPFFRLPTAPDPAASVLPR